MLQYSIVSAYRKSFGQSQLQGDLDHQQSMEADRLQPNDLHLSISFSSTSFVNLIYSMSFNNAVLNFQNPPFFVFSIKLQNTGVVVVV